MKLEILKLQNPIGHVRIETTNINPSTYLGFGTWILWGSGKIPIGVDTSQTEFNTVEKTGGEKTHTMTINELVSHTHIQNSHTHTLNNHTHSIPAHAHGLNNHTHSFSATTNSNGAHTHGVGQHASQPGLAASGTDIGAEFLGNYAYNNFNTNSNGAHTHTVSGTTGGNSGNTANSAALTSGTNNGNTSGTTAVNQNTGSGNPFNILPPYITCYMFKRTA